MELRHLRYFIAVAEELHFARAAERLHIEQSPLSRAIKDLEHDLDVQLFERTTRSTRLTWAGQVFLDEAKRVLSAVNQAKTSAKAAATGYRGTLRIALSDSIDPLRLAALLAQCREEEPDVEIRLFEVPLAEQTKGLRGGLYDAGITQATLVARRTTPVHPDPMIDARILNARHMAHDVTVRRTHPIVRRLRSDIRHPARTPPVHHILRLRRACRNAIVIAKNVVERRRWVRCRRYRIGTRDLMDADHAYRDAQPDGYPRCNAPKIIHASPIAISTRRPIPSGSVYRLPPDTACQDACLSVASMQVHE
jgi:DNA-binding transcriptional LysR family regulator